MAKNLKTTKTTFSTHFYKNWNKHLKKQNILGYKMAYQDIKLIILVFRFWWRVCFIHECKDGNIDNTLSFLKQALKECGDAFRFWWRVFYIHEYKAGSKIHPSSPYFGYLDWLFLFSGLDDVYFTYTNVALGT